MKRKRVRQPLTQQQKGYLIKIGVVLVCIAISWLIFAPRMGVISIYKQNKALEQLALEKSRLEKENRELEAEIERIESDIEYFEKIAREKHNLLRKNELLFDFSKDKSSKE